MLIILTILSKIKDFFVAIATWYVVNWRFTIPLTIYLISIWGALEWQKKHDAELYEIRYESAVHDFNIKVKAIEDNSKERADSAAANSDVTQASIDKVLSEVGIIKGKVNKPLFVIDKSGACRPNADWADAFNKLSEAAKGKK